MDKSKLADQKEPDKKTKNKPVKEAKQITYHVKCDRATGRVYAGTINKKGTRWLSVSDVTNEALSAVRDHFINILNQQKDGTNAVGCQWETKDGKYVSLQLSVSDRQIGG